MEMLKRFGQEFEGKVSEIESRVDWPLASNVALFCDGPAII